MNGIGSLKAFVNSQAELNKTFSDKIIQLTEAVNYLLQLNADKIALNADIDKFLEGR